MSLGPLPHSAQPWWHLPVMGGRYVLVHVLEVVHGRDLSDVSCEARTVCVAFVSTPDACFLFCTALFCTVEPSILSAHACGRDSAVSCHDPSSRGRWNGAAEAAPCRLTQYHFLCWTSLCMTTCLHGCQVPSTLEGENILLPAWAQIGLGITW